MSEWTTFLRRKLKSGLPTPILDALRLLKHSQKPLPNREIYQSFVNGRRGVEIGGPSILFRTALPLYRGAGSVDGVNFSGNTVWEGAIAAGNTYAYYPGRKGVQFISEATDLSQIVSETYDFALSSNCLEHVANPIKALLEWKRIVRPGGALILVVPNKAGNFDHDRPFTSFEHMLEDYERGTTERDLTHLDEILSHHDLAMDPPAGSLEAFKVRSLDNFNNRTLHHHVFEPATTARMLDYVGMSVIATSETATDFFSLALKS